HPITRLGLGSLSLFQVFVLQAELGGFHFSLLFVDFLELPFRRPFRRPGWRGLLGRFLRIAGTRFRTTDKLNRQKGHRGKDQRTRNSSHAIPFLSTMLTAVTLWKFMGLPSGPAWPRQTEGISGEAASILTRSVSEAASLTLRVSVCSSGRAEGD